MKLNTIIFILFSIILFSSCTNNSESAETSINTPPPLPPKEATQHEIFSKIHNSENIRTQVFSVGKKDTVINCKNGTKVKIYANSFQFKDSTKNITGPVEIEIKEAFDKTDFVLGNLTTISEDGILESGGMIYISAKVGNENVVLADGKEIGVSIPTKKLKPGMQIYQGVMDSNQINWVAPQPTLNKKAKKLERTRYKANYTYYKYGEPITQTERDAIWEVIMDEKTESYDRVMVKGHILQIKEITKTTIKFNESEDGVVLQDVVTNKGVNSFIDDYNTNYIFSVKQLGWANIDRIYKDPKAEFVDLIVEVNNLEEFDYVYTSLIFDDKEIYLPGYQKKDNSFSFTHNDAEKFVSPIGEEVTILATSYKGDKPFFQIQKFKIKKEQTINLNLVETNIEELKNQLEQKL